VALGCCFPRLGIDHKSPFKVQESLQDKVIDRFYQEYIDTGGVASAALFGVAITGDCDDKTAL
jgi:hypothetical protein